MQKVKAEIAKNQERIDYAEKTMLDRQMDMSEYRVIRSKYEAAIKNLKDEMKEAAPLSPDFRKFLDFGFNILETADRNMLQAAQNLKDKYIVRCCPKN
jgi:hypothetical protein